MRITAITCGRTYNMGHYTSRRFELSAALDAGEDEEQAMAALSDICHHAALAVFRRERLHGYTDADGYHDLAPDPGDETGEEEDDEFDPPY